MTTISTVAQTQQVIQNLAAMQTQGNNLEQEISTGLAAQNFSGLAPQAAQLVSLSGQQSQQQGYVNTIDTVNNTLSSMSLAAVASMLNPQSMAVMLQTKSAELRSGPLWFRAGGAPAKACS